MNYSLIGFLKKFIQTLGFIVLIPASVLAVHDDIGKLTVWHKTDSGIKGQTENAFFSISYYNENCIRIRVSKQENLREFSYLLDPQCAIQKIVFNIFESENKIILSTDRFITEIEKYPMFRITFKTKEGRIINEDMGGTGFGYSFNGLRSNLYKKMQDGERFIGLGEVLGNLDKRGNCYTLNNTDTYKYGDPRLPMYTNVPFYIGIHHSLVYGIFYHNTYKSFFNFGVSTPEFTSITCDGGDIDYFFISDEDVPGILANYTLLTGRMPLPPKWSLGYHQSRCSYFPQQTVLDLANRFRNKKIPVDCIVLDADYLWEYEPFRIDSTRFPDMSALTKQLSALGIEVTASVNPGIKIDSTYFAHDDGLKNDVFIKYTDGRVYTAEIAPSLNNFVDFTNPSSRNWWADNMKFLSDHGIHGYWNDMNEPAVGASYLPDNLRFNFEGYGADALEAKNVYGMLMARSSFESALKYGNGRRPFVLTRSGFAGVQRYAAVWTGDNTAKDEFLLSGTLLNAQMGLSGIPFVGDDIGGYIGPTSRELFIRWIEAGVFQPFVRNHKESYAADNEPWSYGAEAEAIAREYIGFRYKLLPYLYSTFFETSLTGIPVVRSLSIYEPFNNLVYDPKFQSQFMLGKAFLIIPVTSQEKSRDLYLPVGTWYDIFNDDKLNGGNIISADCPNYKIPVYVKASSIIPMQELVQSTAEQPSDTLFVHFYMGDENNSFEYYEDDGMTLLYKKNQFYKRMIEFDAVKKSISFSKKQGEFDSHYHYIQLIIHGFDDPVQSIYVNSKIHVPLSQEMNILNPLKALAFVNGPDFYDLPGSGQKSPVVKIVTFTNSNDEIRIDLH